MKLLDEIVDVLSDEKGSLNSALLKTKVLMHTVGHAELADWVSNELNGYAAGEPLPDYRVVPGRVAGNVQSLVAIHADIDLPTNHLPPEFRRDLLRHELRQPISVLEEMAAGTSYRSYIPPEQAARFNEALAGGFAVERAWVEIQSLQIKRGLSQIRTRLLDFILQLRDKVGGVKEEEVKAAAAGFDVTAMFNGAVFGDNATVVVGNFNKVKVANKKGDFDALVKLLKEHGVAHDDIVELKSALDADEGKVDLAKKTFGPAVRAWMSNLLKKAADASWQIELGIAGGLLTEALKAYYF